MNTNVAKWGNSLALRLPRSIAADARLREGSNVEIRVVDGSVVITPTRPKYRLEDLLADYREEHRHGEAERGRPVGKEAW